jgi:D-alanyl-lipoteichoic acid acyltransferase DltB (MBOAT superfamily)
VASLLQFLQTLGDVTVVQLVIYLIAGRLILRRLSGGLREALFAGLNLAGYYFFFVRSADIAYSHVFVAYGGLVAVQFLTLRLFAGQPNWKTWIAFYTPIAFLVLIRYVPARVLPNLTGHSNEWLFHHPDLSFAPFFVGLSYLAFRTSHLVLEVRNGVEKMPSFCQYLGFCFFVPTMPVGPINPYHNFRQAFGALPPALPFVNAAMRILVGLVKFKFLGSLCDRLSYSGLLQDDHYHHWVDLPVAAIFYYLYLFCNFSGYCDMAIGAAGLMGVPVAENFNNPFAARNVKDFWNRWHITLSVYMRDVVFAPLSKYFARLFGPAHVNHAVTLPIIVVFLLVGVWHGVGWNYAAYGAVHALGLVINHYYTLGLKKWLGREGFKAYNANRWIQAAAVTLTFCYCAASMFFFANTFPEMKAIFASLK